MHVKLKGFFRYVYVYAVVRICERKTVTIFYSIFADALCVSDGEEVG
jgi:hypothetical protein